MALTIAQQNNLLAFLAKQDAIKAARAAVTEKQAVLDDIEARRRAECDDAVSAINIQYAAEWNAAIADLSTASDALIAAEA